MGGERRVREARVAYTLPQLAEISAIDYRTLHNWQKRGMLRPSCQAANGSGTVNLFDEADALQILILAELRRAGVEVATLERIAPKIREQSAELNGEEVLVISEAGVVRERRSRLHAAVSADRPTLIFGAERVREALHVLQNADSRAT